MPNMVGSYCERQIVTRRDKNTKILAVENGARKLLDSRPGKTAQADNELERRTELSGPQLPARRNAAWRSRAYLSFERRSDGHRRHRDDRPRVISRPHRLGQERRPLRSRQHAGQPPLVHGRYPPGADFQTAAATGQAPRPRGPEKHGAAPPRLAAQRAAGSQKRVRRDPQAGGSEMSRELWSAEFGLRNRNTYSAIRNPH